MEIQSADRKLRFVAIILLVLMMILALASLLLLERWIIGVQALEPELALGKLHSALWWLLVAGCLSLAVFGAWLWRLGNAIKAAQRFPLPGARVIRDTPVLNGDDAIRRSMLFRGLGIFLLLATIALAVLAWRFWAIFAVSAGQP